MHHILKKAASRYRRLHVFSRNAIHGSLQFTVILYIFALVTDLIAPYTPDFFRTIAYRDAALEIAPVTLAAGIVVALLADLVLRRGDADKK